MHASSPAHREDVVQRARPRVARAVLLAVRRPDGVAQRAVPAWACGTGSRVGVPVVVVGNLTVGGTGKTPLVAWLSSQLAATGMRVAIVSRGYGGRARGVTRVTVHSRPSEVGDEPLLLARRAQATVFVGTRSRRGGQGRGGRQGRHRDLRRWTAAPGADARLRDRGHRRAARLRQRLPAAARTAARELRAGCGA